MTEVSVEKVARKYQHGRPRLKPFPAGALNSEPFDLKGSRTLARTPENFPKLEPSAHQFLHTLADVSVGLEERLSLQIARSWQARNPRFVADLYRPYSPASVDGLVGVLCSLTTLPIPPTNGEIRNGGNLVSNPATQFKIVDCSRDLADNSLKLVLRPKESNNNSRTDSEATIDFHPTGSYMVYRTDGEPYWELCGHPKKELSEMLTYRGWSPDRIRRWLERYKETPPGIIAYYENAILTIEFVDNQANCSLAVKSARYSEERRLLPGGPSSTDKVGEPSWRAEMKMPLEKFGGPVNKPTGIKVAGWLQSIITEIEKKAKIEESFA